MIKVDHVDKVFGASPKEVLARLDRGESREVIREATGALVALAGVSIEARPGEILVLMGLSGSGKSTLLRCINGLVRPDRGRVLIEDGAGTIDVAAASPEVLRRVRRARISMVFQQHSLLPWRTVRQNVALGPELGDMDEAAIRRVVDEKLELVGLGEWKDKLPEELSGGMQQRVGLARALATDADILLLDEPFSALDPLIRRRLQDELLHLQRTLRKTMVFVSHDLDEALRVGSRVVILEGGRVEQIGTPTEIVTAPASEHVRRFVAQVNPVHVLRGAALMTPVAHLERDPRDGDTVLLDPEGDARCTLDREGRPVAVRLRGQEARIVPAREASSPGELPEGAVVTVGLDIPMRDAVALGCAVGRPMPVLDADGKLAGVIGAREMLRGMLGTSAGSAAV